MNYKLFSAVLVVFVLFSCQKNDEKQLAEQRKDAQAKELIFTKISNGWHFRNPALNPVTQGLVQNWKELREFDTELHQTPKSSIGAFQKKSKDLSKKALALNNNIPPAFNKPQVKSRISALVTKINSINLFINLDAIPEQKVIALVGEVDIEMISLYQQMDEIVRKSQIPTEEGESDMIRMLDTTRAIPN
ncbi:hypothetical protein [Flavobacterium sp.]|uniref:hypothetical protein n=1 Tax=Flavobacterium sp. TaxID=239 RepID=UPI00260F5A9A|nr:hypothetical protein [Flavobacterium sp.]